MRHCMRLVLPVMTGLLAGMVSPAWGANNARVQIEAALTHWKDAFNAGHADEVCNLFAHDLRADFRGQPERGYDALCALLRRSLANRKRVYTYALTIKEILVWGDTAVVRLVWTLTVRQRDSDKVTTSVEPGLDVFRRQRDGHWRIVRYIAYAQ